MMLIFWLKATWRNNLGWEITYTCNRCASSRKEAENGLIKCFGWLEKRLPSSFYFMGIELIKVEEILGTEPIKVEEI